MICWWMQIIGFYKLFAKATNILVFLKRTVIISKIAKGHLSWKSIRWISLSLSFFLSVCQKGKTNGHHYHNQNIRGLSLLVIVFLYFEPFFGKLMVLWLSIVCFVFLIILRFYFCLKLSVRYHRLFAAVTVLKLSSRKLKPIVILSLSLTFNFDHTASLLKSVPYRVCSPYFPFLWENIWSSRIQKFFNTHTHPHTLHTAQRSIPSFYLLSALSHTVLWLICCSLSSPSLSSWYLSVVSSFSRTLSLASSPVSLTASS